MATVSMIQLLLYTSGIARAFPGGRATHLEGQNEDKNEESKRKNDGNLRKNESAWTLAHL